METYSTSQVAKQVGISKPTLIRWLLDRKVKEPRRVKQGGVEIRLWRDRDVERVRKHKEETYRKGRGRKAKPKR
jgi:phage antirepressor YoqD-like protein